MIIIYNVKMMKNQNIKMIFKHQIKQQEINIMK
jgi:hypothetical protein